MKKSLFLMALTSVTMVSCVSDEVADVAQNDLKENVKIMFDRPLTYNNSSSRANVFGLIGNHTYEGQTYSYPNNEKFIIYAAGHTGNYAGGWSAPYDFNGQAISHDKDLDGWAPKTPNENAYYYWPDNKKLTFAATSPAVLYEGDVKYWTDNNWPNGESYGNEEELKAAENQFRYYDGTGLHIKNFKVSPDASKQYDLLFSKRSFNNTAENMQEGAGDYNGVPLVFQHALSSIRFSFKKAAGVEQEVLLHKIELFGVKDEGSFNENITEDNNDWDKYERGVNVNPIWNFDAEQSKIENMVSQSKAYIAFNCEEGVAFPSAAQFVSTAAAGIEHVHNYLLLLPQELMQFVEKDDPETDIEEKPSLGAAIKVKYSVKEGEETVYHNKIVALKDLQGRHVVKEENITVGRWEVGHQYIYRLVIGGDAINAEKIYFAPTTEAWQEVTAIEVHI